MKIGEFKKMKKCYSKEIEYIVPKLHCSMCGKHIKIGEELCSVVLKWGDGRTTCRECYDQYEIDCSLLYGEVE